MDLDGCYDNFSARTRSILRIRNLGSFQLIIEATLVLATYFSVTVEKHQEENIDFSLQSGAPGRRNI